MLNVLITVDTEVWPRLEGAVGRELWPEVDRDIFGKTPRGEFGVRFQTDLLNEHGLKAVYHVESLFSYAAGLEPLAQVVDAIQGAGHDVQLHLHSEWLDKADLGFLAGRSGRHIASFAEDEQEELLSRGIARLKEAGAVDVNAFRAGNFGANAGTLRALARCGVTFDTSYNVTFPGSTEAFGLDRPLLQPQRLYDVWEVPISFYEDRPGHRRHVQVNGCSWSEMQSSLMQAWRRGWETFVIVFHSFELMNRRRTGPDPVVMRRFRRLCRFLANNPDKFRTATFQDLVPEADGAKDGESTPLRSNLARTSWRLCEQVVRKVFR